MQVQDVGCSEAAGNRDQRHLAIAAQPRAKIQERVDESEAGNLVAM